MNFRRYSLGVLAWNLAVIVWGAFVRASKSGDGCGDHWPKCNGEVLPTAPTVKTVIEFSHRVTSGLALIAVVALVVWAFRAYPRGHVVRKGAATSMFFMLTEAGVGAALVLFKLVAGNDTLGRALFMAVHLVNTFLLVACLALTVFWAHGGGRPRFAGRGRELGLIFAALSSVILLGVSGAITALGDTLFPAVSLIEGLKSDFAPTAHLFVRLRIWHPMIAIASSLFVAAAVVLLPKGRDDAWLRKASSALGGLVIAQLTIGAVNVALLAPVWIQLVHLLVADLLWIALVILCASSLAEAATEEVPTA